jgi:outer membrane protein assembly factor BamE (lipoprotein component of BamABCDE complex)
VPRLSFRSLPALLLTTGLLSGCSFFEQPPQLRGNAVDPDALKELVVGTSTRADVNSLLGSPTARAVFDDNTWFYISEVTQPRIGRVQGINSQAVVVMNFDQGGVLRDIKKLDKADGKPVEVVSRATPSPGSDATFLQQLLGNVGKFTPGAGSSATTNNAGSSGGSVGRGSGT